MSKGNLRKSWRKRRKQKIRKRHLKYIHMYDVKERGLAKEKDTDHATGKIVVFPGRVDDGAVLVEPD